MLELKSIGYVMVLINEDERNHIQATIATVVEIAEAEAMVEAIIGAIEGHFPYYISRFDT